MAIATGMSPDEPLAKPDTTMLGSTSSDDRDVSFCQYGVIILSNIACSSHERRVLVADAGGIDAILGVMQTHAVRSRAFRDFPESASGCSDLV